MKRSCTRAYIGSNIVARVKIPGAEMIHAADTSNSPTADFCGWRIAVATFMYVILRGNTVDNVGSVVNGNCGLTSLTELPLESLIYLVVRSQPANIEPY